MARLRVTDSGFSDVVTAGLKHLRSFPKSISKYEDDYLRTVAEPLSVHVPAVIVERARPWLVTPSYEATGYNYRRVHLAREMREGVVRILVSALPHATYSYTPQLGTSSLLYASLSRRRVIPPNITTTPVKRMRLFAPTPSSSSSKSPSRTRVSASTLNAPTAHASTSTSRTTLASLPHASTTSTSTTTSTGPEQVRCDPGAGNPRPQLSS